MDKKPSIPIKRKKKAGISGQNGSGGSERAGLLAADMKNSAKNERNRNKNSHGLLFFKPIKLTVSYIKSEREQRAVRRTPSFWTYGDLPEKKYSMRRLMPVSGNGQKASNSEMLRMKNKTPARTKRLPAMIGF